jgi:hypothetical protein
MSYDVGTHINLAYLNSKREVVETMPRKSVLQKAIQNSQEASSTLFDVGTQFAFDIKEGKAKISRRIQVVCI